MTFDVFNNLTLSLSPNGQLSSSKLDNIMAKIQEAVDIIAFREVANGVLLEIEDPVILSQCAELIRQREPGGTYYRAKYWTKTVAFVEAYTVINGGSLKLGDLCKRTGVSMSQVKALSELGRAIEQVEQELGDNTSLSTAPATLFQYAQRQQKRTGDYLREALLQLRSNSNSTIRQIHRRWCQQNGSTKANLDIIKPSDWWSFSHPKWRKEDDFQGSIPGEVYANALYYFAPRRGIAIDPMAGSGMLKRVYEDRMRWQKDSEFDLSVILYDLYPRRDYIQQHDARQPLPIKADWIFIDPPYYRQSDHLYEGDIAATRSYQEYLLHMNNLVQALADSLNPLGRLCVFLPKWSGQRSVDPNYDIPSDVKQLAIKVGLNWIDAAFVSRGRQQEGGSARKNNSAKRERRMRSDTCILNVFEKPEG